MLNLRVTKDIFAIASNGWTIIDTQTSTIKEDYFFSEEEPEGMGQYESVYKPLLQGDHFTFLGKKKRTMGASVGLVFSITKPVNLFGNMKSSAKRNAIQLETS